MFMKKATPEMTSKAIKNQLTVTLIARKSQDDDANVESFDPRNSKAYEAVFKTAKEFTDGGFRCLLLIPETIASEQMFSSNFSASETPLTLSQRGGVQRSADVFLIQKGMHEDAIVEFIFSKDNWNGHLNRILFENAHTSLASKEDLVQQRFVVNTHLAAKRFQNAYDVKPGTKVWLDVPSGDDFTIDEDPLSHGYQLTKTGKSTLVPVTF